MDGLEVPGILDLLMVSSSYSNCSDEWRSIRNNQFCNEIRHLRVTTVMNVIEWHSAKHFCVAFIIDFHSVFHQRNFIHNRTRSMSIICVNVISSISFSNLTISSIKLTFGMLKPIQLRNKVLNKSFKNNLPK